MRSELSSSSLGWMEHAHEYGYTTSSKLTHRKKHDPPTQQVSVTRRGVFSVVYVTLGAPNQSDHVNKPEGVMSEN